MHPKGYTKEDIKRLLGTSWPKMPEDHETGNQMIRRKGQEMRSGKRPYPKYPSKESRIADTSGKFDENGQYIYDFLLSSVVVMSNLPSQDYRL